MDLSICIPIYNVDITQLILELTQEVDSMDESIEILCIDDKSTNAVKARNKMVLDTINSVRYIELEHNQGRAKIRNTLRDLAVGSHLLYLDCDVAITSKDFVKNYIDQKQNGIVYGGLQYQEQVPEATYRLHWSYGRKYEAASLPKRRQSPVATFLSCNFMVERSIITSIPFDDSIDGYGYEDIAWIHSCSHAGYQVTHIQNPVIHLGLDDNKRFMDKIDKSLQNLQKLAIYSRIPETTLMKWQGRLQSAYLTNAIDSLLYPVAKSVWRNKLQRDHGSTNLLQLYKLVIYNHLILQNRS